MKSGPRNTWRASDVFPTGHVDHSAVAVLHQVSGLTVDPAGRDAVAAEEVRIHRRGLAVTPGRRQVRQLRKTEAPEQNHLDQAVDWTPPLACEVLTQRSDLSANIVTNALICPPKKSDAHLLNVAPERNLISTQWWTRAHQRLPWVLFSYASLVPTLPLRCPHFLQEWKSISCSEQRWC